APGNASLVRILIIRGPSAQAFARPTLSAAIRGGEGSGLAVVTSVIADAHSSAQFVGLLALIRPSTAGSQSHQKQSVSVRTSSGFSLGTPQTVPDVLYENELPKLPVETPASGRLSAGSLPPNADPLRALRAVRQLALERPANTADMELLGLQYVAVRLQRLPSGSARYSATVSITRLSQVNAIE